MIFEGGGSKNRPEQKLEILTIENEFSKKFPEAKMPTNKRDVLLKFEIERKAMEFLKNSQNSREK
ncbi:hypothetical protein [Sulfurimonas sp.]|uniref:hypothetical protein n=1 Tax=Sulfurimonas sp. TaxID=2022749 RepID=UPI003D0B70E1